MAALRLADPIAGGLVVVVASAAVPMLSSPAHHPNAKSRYSVSAVRERSPLRGQYAPPVPMLTQIHIAGLDKPCGRGVQELRREKREKGAAGTKVTLMVR